MPGVMMPQKKQGMTAQLLPVAGQAAGAAIGGPVGGMVGGMIGGKLAGDQKQAAPVETSAISRKIDSYQVPEDPSKDLMAAEQALAQMPPPVQQQYSPIIKRARELDAQQRGMA